MTKPDDPFGGHKPVRKLLPGSFNSLLLWAAITFVFSVLALGLWMVRLNTQNHSGPRPSKPQEKPAIATGNRGQAQPFAVPLPPSTPSLIGKGIDIPLSFTNGTTSQRTVALTFNGDALGNTARAILDTLKTRHITATIFVTGEFMARYPNSIRRLLAEGHEIGNLTEHYPHLTAFETQHVQRTLPNVNHEFLRRELGRANAAFFRITGRPLWPFWRAPYGEANPQICAWAQKCGYIHIGWREGSSWLQNLDGNDWVAEGEKGYHSPQEVLQKILAIAHTAPDGLNGGIILMYLGTRRKDGATQVHRVLGQLIDSLNALNYAIVPVGKLLAEAGVNVAHLPARDSVGPDTNAVFFPGRH
jgi:peptidoglycan/xylan/chitin deacetylase (PgdA/CDA1 family)